MPYTQNWGISRNAFQSPLHNNGEENNQATNIIKKNNKRSWLDWTQDALTVAGMVPAFGAIPDLINTVVSGGRAAYAGATGDKEALNKHLGYAALNLAAAVPVAGQAAGASKLAMSANKVQKAVKNVVPDLAEVSIKAGKAQKYGVKGFKGVKSGSEELELAENREKDNIIKNAPIYAGDDDPNTRNPFIKPKTHSIFI